MTTKSKSNFDKFLTEELKNNLFGISSLKQSRIFSKFVHQQT